VSYADPANKPVRIIAQGRDPSAAIDSALGAIPGNGFQNDGDNELSGIHVSDGSRNTRRQNPASVPRRLARVLHGPARQNYTQEIIPNRQKRVDFGEY
jgi:hypothetical protein